MKTTIPGELEIDSDRGVIYFHTSNPIIAQRCGSVTLLRIQNLPKSIPSSQIDIHIDITNNFAKVFYNGVIAEEVPTPEEISRGTGSSDKRIEGDGETTDQATSEGTQVRKPKRGKDAAYKD